MSTDSIRYLFTGISNQIKSFISGNMAHRNRKADRQKQTGTQKHTQKHTQELNYNRYSFTS